MDFANGLLTALDEIVNDTKWQKVGTSEELQKHSYTKLYADVNDEDMVVQPDNIVLFSIGNDQFYAIDCSCPHEGGPLDLGDIEDIGGELAVICPWHSYDFSLTTGKSMTGLTTNIYEVKVVNGDVYINCDYKLYLEKVKSVKTENCNSLYDDDHDDNGAQKEALETTSEKLTEDNSLTWHARKILTTADPDEKARSTHEIYENLKNGKIKNLGSCIMPGQPSRKEGLNIKEPGQIKRGRGGTLQSRIALLHSLGNIEQWAIDLAWDIIGRFSMVQINNKPIPKEFFEDFAKVADDEAKHFLLINQRLEELNSYFGALPVHNGLWQSAEETSHDLLARLAIVHMVHEARGLDVHPKTSERFASQNDKKSVALMEIIYTDEITHVACGMKWFTYVCHHSQPPLDPVLTFHKLVRKHFKGYLKPPFNTSGRGSAGMTEEPAEPVSGLNSIVRFFSLRNYLVI